jgi:hypothetical protein
VANRLGDLDDIKYQYKHLTSVRALVYSERAYQAFDELRGAIEYFEKFINRRAIDDIVQSASTGQIAGGGGERLSRVLLRLNEGLDDEQYSTAEQPHFASVNELIGFISRYSGDIRGLPHGYCTKGAACKIRNAADPSHCLYCDTYFATPKHLPYWRVIKANCESRLRIIHQQPESIQKQLVAFRQTLDDNLLAANKVIDQLSPKHEAGEEVG